MGTLAVLLGVELDEVSWREKCISGAGGSVAILSILAISHHLIGLSDTVAILAVAIVFNTMFAWAGIRHSSAGAEPLLTRFPR